MLTPNDIRRRKAEIETRIEARVHRITPPLATRQTLLMELYEEVLREIAHGSIDPKSLAQAALEPW